MIEKKKTAPSSYLGKPKDKIAKVIPYALNCIVFILLCLALFTGYKSIHQINVDNTESIEFINEVEFKTRAYISGAVISPGVYEITEVDRVIDLITMAGGFAPEYDDYFVAKSINLSARVFNEDHIFVPYKGQNIDSIASSTGYGNSSLINLNTATLEELDSLPGIGAVSAQRIIEARPFQKIDDLKNVEGIGDATFDKLKDLVYVE